MKISEIMSAMDAAALEVILWKDNPTMKAAASAKYELTQSSYSDARPNSMASWALNPKQA